MSDNLKILIVGQGISGTMLSWYCHKANIPFIVIDEPIENSASKVAAGLINPVTGRRIVKTWMIDTLMPFAANAYRDFGKDFKIKVVEQKSIVDFFPTKQMEEAFEERVKENADYLHLANEKHFKDLVQYHLNYGIVSPCYIIQIQKVLSIWQDFLQARKLLSIEAFVDDELKINNNNLLYKNVAFSHIVFANGEKCRTNRWFKNLPWASNKGEALIIECKDLPEDFVYKKGISIIPIRSHRFWVGANYIWNYEDEKPTTMFYNNTKKQLEQILISPFTIIDHKAALRPANVERRPFVGFHPLYSKIGILNGMGAKGTSLAPYFANQLVENILLHTPIDAEADVARFTKILSRE